jgi:hypothetical protein
MVELLFIGQLVINNVLQGEMSREITFALRLPQFAVQTTLQIVSSKDLYNKVVDSIKACHQKLF